MPTTSTSSIQMASGEENAHPNHARPTSRSNTNPFNDQQTRNRKRQKQSNTKKTAEAIVTRKKTKNSGTKMRPMASQVEALPDLSRAEKEASLAKIEDEFDRNLQMVLFEVDCNYVLLQHQFLGVRALTGVPDDFPGVMKLKAHDLGSAESEDDAVFDWVVSVLKKSKPRRPEGNDRGVLMADSMGLGKTVVSVCACILRNAIAQTRGTPKMPTLIISPNDSVLKQWHETLLKAGIDKNKIFRFVAKSTVQLKGEVWVLANRYNLQTELRYMWGDEKKKTIAKSVLLPNASTKMMLLLKNQYLAANGKVKNEHIGQGDAVTPSEVITDALGEHMDRVERTYQTVCIDEAHFLKSLVTYWGCAAGLLGLQSERMIPLSGTPFNNSLQDVATLMTMIDPTADSSLEKWWKQATKSTAAEHVISSISEWNKDFLVRRGKEVIAANLPKKTVRRKQVASYPLELHVYEEYENGFLDVLQRFQNLEARGWNPVAQAKLKEYFQRKFSVSLYYSMPSTAVRVSLLTNHSCSFWSSFEL